MPVSSCAKRGVSPSRQALPPGGSLGHGPRDDTRELVQGLADSRARPGRLRRALFERYLWLARVVDFGVARARGRAVITKDGELKGKLPYMPPEQLRAAELDRRA